MFVAYVCAMIFLKCISFRHINKEVRTRKCWHPVSWFLAFAGHCLHVLSLCSLSHPCQGSVLLKILYSASIPSAPQLSDRMSTLLFYNTIQCNTIQYNTIQYSILYWSLLLGKLPSPPLAHINLHTDYMETMYIHCIRDMHYSKRHWAKGIWQAHRPPRALQLKTVTACGTNEFEYLTVLAFGTLILPLRTISRLSNSCLKGCVMSFSMSFSLFNSHSSIVQCVEIVRGPALHTTCLPDYLVQHLCVSFARIPTPD